MTRAHSYKLLTYQNVWKKVRCVVLGGIGLCKFVPLYRCSHDDLVITAVVVPAMVPFSQIASAATKHTKQSRMDYDYQYTGQVVTCRTSRTSSVGLFCMYTLYGYVGRL